MVVGGGEVKDSGAPAVRGSRVLEDFALLPPL
jgi:hypothetical protein